MTLDPNSDVAQNRFRVMEVLRDLRYSGTVQSMPPVLDLEQDEAGFLKDVGLWLTEYSRRVSQAAQGITDMASELDELRKQRAAIRSFLGIPPIGVP